ncbi:MAG: SDR family NAD(P)-dependent oxidoreductase [Myxococcota bacterium]
MGFLGSLLDRSIVFSFDKTGFRRHAKRFVPSDLDVDLRGQVCLVTGASSGLGVAVVRGLAERGAEVRMLCRNVSKGEAVRAELPDAANVVVDRIDLSDFASIRAFAESFPRDRVDVLVHNAGVLPDAQQTTADDLELTAATNLVGPFLLTHCLWPKLRHGARMVHVSSGGMYAEPLEVDALLSPPAPFDGVRAYARTKRAQVVLTKLLDARSPLRVSSMHPGWADTPGVASSLPRFYALTKVILRTPEEGADTIVWLAASPAASAPKGQFFFDRQPQPIHLSSKTHTSSDEERRLWTTLCALVGADPEKDFR